MLIQLNIFTKFQLFYTRYKFNPAKTATTQENGDHLITKERSQMNSTVSHISLNSNGSNSLHLNKRAESKIVSNIYSIPVGPFLPPNWDRSKQKAQIPYKQCVYSQDVRNGHSAIKHDQPTHTNKLNQTKRQIQTNKPAKTAVDSTIKRMIPRVLLSNRNKNTENIKAQKNSIRLIPYSNSDSSSNSSTDSKVGCDSTPILDSNPVLSCNSDPNPNNNGTQCENKLHSNHDQKMPDQEESRSSDRVCDFDANKTFERQEDEFHCLKRKREQCETMESSKMSKQSKLIVCGVSFDDPFEREYLNSCERISKPLLTEVQELIDSSLQKSHAYEFMLEKAQGQRF